MMIVVQHVTVFLMIMILVCDEGLVRVDLAAASMSASSRSTCCVFDLAPGPVV